ncbi:MAG: DUF4416 family protein [Planctomycetes bacterium]|nr:DUF4416 family protein [Planctomycetota bacterium]
MGELLVKRLIAFRDLVGPGALPAVKRVAMEIEHEFAERHSFASRPINLDPGYLTEAKVVLASTKDRGHRVYLAGGIFAEATLEYREGRFHPFPWTYADFRSEPVLAFFALLRESFREERPERGETTPRRRAARSRKRSPRRS